MYLNTDALETSFDQIAPRGDELMDVFYRRLFVVAPSMLPLFLGLDLERLKRRLLAQLMVLRGSLRDLDSVTPLLRGLGARNARYGALPEHYPVAAMLLMTSMAEIAGEAWTDEHQEAWTEAFALVSCAMIDGAHSAAVNGAAA
jgi:hemoglobin-like flavoprotein